MKKIFFFLLLLLCSALHAQEALEIITTPPPGYVTYDHAFAQLNTNQVASGILIDRSTPFVNLERFSGATLSDTNKVNVNTLGLAYARLSGSVLDISDTLPSPKTVLGKLGKPADTIPLKILFYDYHRLKPDALTAGDIQVSNNQILNVPGRNPFEAKTVFMAVPWVLPKMEGSSFVFRLQAPIANRAADIQQIQVDFADGQGWRTLTVGQVLSISYTESDTFTLRTRLTLYSGQVLQSHSDLAVTVPPTQDRDYEDGFEIEDIAGATVTGLSSCGDQTICKPLIVVEGFNAPAFGDLFETNFESFIDGLEGSNIATPTPLSLFDEFETAGYDIIYVDFDDGTAALEDNAEVVKAVIRRVNELKAAAGCTQPNIVWGESMGGVLAKLALLEMEQFGEDHQCSKLFTFDSPLRGANIPLGYQFMLDHLANMSVGVQLLGLTDPLANFVPILADADNTLEAPGPRQMLIYHMNQFPIPGGPYHTFYNKLRNLGALEDCEHIAISNGSQIGSGQGFAANARMLKIEGDGGAVLDECLGFSGFWAFVVEFLADIAFDTEIEFDFEVRALPSPAQGSSWIYKGEAFAEVFSIDIVDAFREVKVGGTQPLDNASGGFVEIDPGLAPCGIVQIDQPRFCFIPSVSAIEVGPFVGSGSLADVNADISDNAAILASGLTTVDRYIAWDNALPPGANPSTFNQFHTSFSTDNTGILLYELRAEDAATGLLNSQTFNYGTSEITEYNYQNPPAVFPIKQTTNYIDGDLTIESIGKLWINRLGRIAFTDVTSNPNVAHPSSFDVYLDTRVLCNVSSTSTVTVKDGGMLEIGEWEGNTQNKGNLIVSGTSELTIGNGGIMKINKNSKGILRDGGFGVVKNGGLLLIDNGGQMVIEDNGVLHLELGSTLNVTSLSSILIKSGGRLILDPGAIVHLESYDARIRIEGTLVVNGDIDFQGYGYFDFGNGNALEFGPGVQNFTLSGRGIGNRFVRLSNDLAIEAGHGVIWSNGKMESLYGSLLINSGGSCRFNRMEVVSSGPSDEVRAVIADNAHLLIFDYCDFNQVGTVVMSQNTGLHKFYNCNFADLKYGVIAEGGSGFFLVTDCTFEDYSWTAVAISDRPSLTITNSTWEGQEDATGLDLLRVTQVTLRNSHLNGHSGLFDPQAGSFIHAVNLDDVPYFIMRNSGMSGNSIGIKAIGVDGGEPSNVFLLEGSVIQNSEAGIYMIGDATRGLVLMDCASLLGNEVGVLGTDVVLMIDAS